MNEQDVFADIPLFVTVARAGTFTKTAEQLGITKSAVTKAVTRLENRLGFKLFHRTTRLIRLTSDGEAYLNACRHALDEVTAAQTALSSNSQVLSGRIHIDMPVAFGRKVLLPALMNIVRPHPGISLTLTFTDAVSDLLREDVDLAIRFGALAASSHLIARRLTQQRRVICASPGYIKDYGLPTTIIEVAEHRCLVGTPNGPPSSWAVMEEANQPATYEPPKTHQFSDGDAMVDAAVAGMGLLQLPETMVRDKIASGLLREILPGLSGPDVEVHAVWPKRGQLSPRLRYIVDRLLELGAKGELN